MTLNNLSLDIRVDLTGLAGSLGLVNVLKYAVPLISCNIDPGIPRELLIEHNKNIFDLREWSHDSTRLLFRAISDIATMRLSFVPQDPPNSSYRSQYLVQHKVTDPLELNKQKIILYPYYLMAMRQLDRVQKNRYDLMKASLSTWQDGWYPLVLFRWYLKNIRVQI